MKKLYGAYSYPRGRSAPVLMRVSHSIKALDRSYLFCEIFPVKEAGLKKGCGGRDVMSYDRLSTVPVEVPCAR